MDSTLNTRSTLKRELRCFIIAGILATLTDFTIYWFLHSLIYYSAAKTISFLLGSIVAFLLNKFITFKKHQRSVSELARFIILYAFSLLANVIMNSSSIFVLTKINIFYLSQSSIILLAFIAATGTSTILNFLGQKFWVFKTHQHF